MTISTLLPGRSSPVISATTSVAKPSAARRLGEGWSSLLGLVVLIAAAWLISQRHWFKAGDDVGYWLGVVGGVMMLLLLIYPLRKYVRGMHGWGPVKMWLWGHMVLGIGGPLLILLHCGFHARSLNAEAALYSMLVVAGSGVIGRFLYVQVNRDLAVERNALRDFRLKLGLEGDRRSFLSFAPEVHKELLAFDHDVVSPSAGAGAHWVRLLLVLPFRSWISREKAQRHAWAELSRVAHAKGWDAQTLRRHRRRVRRAIRTHFVLMTRVALFAAWERLFALWHVAHIPFVFLLVAAGVVHVVAVHAY